MKPDYAHLQTEKELAKLEKRIAKLYKEARDELDETVKAYFESFEKRDAEMKKLIGTIRNGKEWTEADYKQWRLNQIGRGKRFEALRDLMAERYTQANEVAVSYVTDETPGIYSLNRNYSAYTIDKATGGALTMPNGKMDASWTLFDESTVRRLMVEQPGLMPNYPAAKALKRGIDLAYGKKQITSAVTSAILQGKSIKGIADDLQTRIPDMNRASAIRTARTAITGAQNGGRQDSYITAEKMDIELEREWLATLDNRTRHAHAVLDGQKRPVDKPFEVDGHKIMFPGDNAAPAYLVYNCRCTLIATPKGVDTYDAQRRARDPKTGRNVLIRDMSYAEWAGWKKDNKTTFAVTREEATILLKEKVGFYEVNNTQYLDEELFVTNANRILELNEKFHAIGKNNIGYVTVENTSKFQASAATNPLKPERTKLVFSTDLYSKKTANVAEVIRKEIEHKFAMPATEQFFSTYTVTHEYGHILHNAMINSRWNTTGRLSSISEKYNAMLARSGSSAKKYLASEEVKTAKEFWKEICEIAKEKNPDFKVSENISGYGKTNYYEAFAETFANSQCGEPNELGKAMIVWLERNAV